jgi:DNA-binding SARP family transcriptional activator
MSVASDPSRPTPPGDDRGDPREGPPPIRLRLLGPPRIAGLDGHEIHGVVRRPKLLAVLGYLAAADPGGFQERDELLTLFWPTLDGFRARRSLRKSLHLLRRVLGPEAIVSRGRNRVAVDRRVLWCDVPALRSALAQGERKEALELYRGELLPAFHVRGLRGFGEWVDATRRELKVMVAEAGWDLAEEAAREADVRRAVAWARKALACAWAYDEEAVRRFVEILDGCGCRAEALQVYEAFAGRLEEELGVAPAPETRALIEAVRAR